MEKVSRLYKEKCGGFHTKIPLDMTKETRREIVELLEKVEQSGKWPQQALHKIVFSNPENVTSEMSIVLMPTLICWWEALRAPEVAKWQQKYGVNWDAADDRNGGAQQTVWEILFEMERFKYRAGKNNWEQWHWCWTWQRHLRGIVSQWCGPGRRQFPKEDIAGPMRVLRAPQASRRMCGGVATDHHGHLARVKVELLVFTYCTAECVE